MKLLTAITFIFLSISAQATVTTALVDGDWNNDLIWTNGSPGCFDTIIIPAGVQVDVTTTIDLESCPDSIFILVQGRIEFQNGKKIKLPCNSDVIVMTGGSMGVGSGGGSSTYLEICSTQYWNASQGDLTGPQSLCDGPCPPSQLPIQLVYFNAVLNDEGRWVDLSWVTKSETDNDYFTIQRSVNGNNWEDLLEVDGAGNSLVQQNYYQQDLDPYYGKSYYRLKQTDFDGDYTYSPIVSVYQGSQTNLTVYPNPVITGDDMSVNSNHLVITFPDIENRDYLVQVYSLEGKLMYTTSVDLTETKQLFIPIGPDYSAGMYTIRTELENTKFVVH